MHTLRLVGLMMLALIAAMPSVARADDDEGNPSIPPENPGDGYGDIYPNPTLPPTYVPHSDTSPSGVGSIANTQSNSIRLGQSFQAAASSLDWVAMVFQYNYQPNSGPMDPASFRIHISSGIISSGNNSGELINVLGSTGVESVTPDPLSGDSLGWILFDFPSTVTLTPGNQYYLRIEHTSGYGVDSTGVGVAVGSLGSNAYSAGLHGGPFTIHPWTAGSSLRFATKTSSSRLAQLSRPRQVTLISTATLMARIFSCGSGANRPAAALTRSISPTGGQTSEFRSKRPLTRPPCRSRRR